MIKMVVIEDEPRLCHGIAFHIPWEQHDVEMVGIAYDGKSGEKLILEKQPDIVITDIRMPIMSGLEMIEKVQQEYPFTKYIIISGHDDFEYAKQAMSLGVTNYVVKPTGDKNLISEVNKVKNAIIAETREKQRFDLLEQKWNEYLPTLQEQFFQHWLSRYYSEIEVLEKARKLHLPIYENQHYIVALLDIDRNEHLEKEDPSFDYDFSLLNSINENRYAKNFRAFTSPHRSTVVLFWSSQGEDKKRFVQRTNHSINNWLVHIERSLGITASAGIGRCVNQKELVKNSYEQARSALMSREYFGTNVAISYDSGTPKEELFTIEPSIERKIEFGLESLDDDKVIEILTSYIKDDSDTISNPLYFQEKTYYLITIFIRYIQSKGWLVQNVLGRSITKLYNNEQWQTEEKVILGLVDLMNRIMSFASKSQHASRNQIIQTILNKIDEQLYDEITLQDLADEVFVNSSYLSRLFKNETGQSFSRYVTERKMKVAKNLVYEGHKVSDVSERLAYRDVSYFSKVFRKYWGVTPKEMGNKQEQLFSEF